MFWQQLPPRLPPRLRERRCRAAAPGAAPPFHAAFSRSLPVGVLQSNNQTVSSTLRTHVFLPDLAQVQLHARCMQGCSAMQAALIDPHAVSPPSPKHSGRCLQNPPGKPAAPCLAPPQRCWTTTSGRCIGLRTTLMQLSCARARRSACRYGCWACHSERARRAHATTQHCSRCAAQGVSCRRPPAFGLATWPERLMLAAQASRMCHMRLALQLVHSGP